MIFPPLGARIKQEDVLTCPRVNPRLERELEPVAAHTRQAQIARVGRTTSRLRDNVVDLHLHDDRLRGQAVFAASTRPLGYLPAQCLRDVGHLCPALQLAPHIVPTPLQHKERLRAQERHAVRLVDEGGKLNLLLIR